MTDKQFDLFVIGGGSGGVRAARMAAARGARVALAESGAMGGTCVNLGCIPKKLYSYAAHFSDSFAEARGFGWTVGETTFDWQTLRANRAREILRLNGIYESLLAKVHVVRGRATLVDAHTVAVGEAQFSAKHILVATGGWPQVPDFSGREHVVTSNEMFDLPTFPKRLVVVGGGYIASEFASIFNGLGSSVTQLYRGEQILRGFDADVRQFAADEMCKHGVALRVSVDVRNIVKTADGLLLTLTDDTTLLADAVLYATGRSPNVGDLGLEAVGVEQRKNGAVVVHENYQSSVPSIYALGDVTDRVQLTPVALGEAMQLVDHLFGDGGRKMSYDGIPTAVFTHPNIGSVGLTEAAAREQFGAVRIYRSNFKALKHTLSGSGERTLMKLIVDDATDRVVGLHMVGTDAGEVVQGFAVAMKCGATKAQFDATIGIHPTMAEEFVTMRDAVVA
jgi:glutathione reductase (NADPH)